MAHAQLLERVAHLEGKLQVTVEQFSRMIKRLELIEVEYHHPRSDVVARPFVICSCGHPLHAGGCNSGKDTAAPCKCGGLDYE